MRTSSSTAVYKKPIRYFQKILLLPLQKIRCPHGQPHVRRLRSAIVQQYSPLHLRYSQPHVPHRDFDCSERLDCYSAGHCPQRRNRAKIIFFKGKA